MLRRYSANGMETLPLNKTVITIGNGDNCDITISDPNLAQKHAEIEYHPLPQAYFLRDFDTLSGTTCNGDPVYGMVELKPNNVIRFGYGPEYVFEIPRAIPKSAKKVLQGHKGCLVAKDSSVSLPVVGVKERKILPALPLKPTAQQPPKPRKVRLVSADVVKPAEEKEKRNLLTSDRFSPVSRVRSASMDPSMAKNRAKKAENGRSSSKTDLTSKARVTPSPTSSANSSAEFSNSRRNTVLGTPFSLDYGAATNTNLLQRVVRLQMELHRRDLEINQLRDRILVNPTPAELSQKTTHPLSPMDAVFPDKIYKRTDSHPRSPIELQSPQTGPLKPLSALHSFESNQDRMNEMELEVRNDFLKLLAKSMTTLNDRLLSFPMRDYADIFSEMTRCLFEPLSYTVMETQKQCAENINRRYLLISERQAAHQQLESFMQNSIQPLIKQIEMILPVVRDAAMIARESVKVCNVFTAWSREFGDEIRTNGLTSNMLLNKADALLSRFKENSLTKHWLPPSLTPLLRVASLEFRKRIESRPVKLLTNSSSQTETECLEPERPQSSVKENVKVAHEPSKPRESKIPVKQHDAQSGILSNSKNVSKENKIEKLSMVTHLPVVERLLQETAPITPRSDCSSVSQKASTDSEQLSQLHKLARHLAKDVFQNLELRPNFSSEQSETDETEITTPKKSEASTTPRTPASTPTKLEHLPSGDFVKGAETSSDSSVQPKRSITKLSSIESSSSASMSLPAFLNSVAVMEPANEDQSVYSDLPLPESTQHRTIGDDPSLLQKDSNLLNLTYISHVRHDAPSRLSHRSEHHTELDEPVDSVEERMKRKRSSEFWRLATNLGSALALEKEIANTRNKKLSESEKRAVVMESLMVGIHEILENIKTEHEKLDEEARSDKVSLK